MSRKYGVTRVPARYGPIPVATRAMGGLTVRHGSCRPISEPFSQSMPPAMAWGSSAVAEKTDQVQATRTDATTMISARTADRSAVMVPGRRSREVQRSAAELLEVGASSPTRPPDYPRPGRSFASSPRRSLLWRERGSGAVRALPEQALDLGGAQRAVEHPRRVDRERGRHLQIGRVRDLDERTARAVQVEALIFDASSEGDRAAVGAVIRTDRVVEITVAMPPADDAGNHRAARIDGDAARAAGRAAAAAAHGAATAAASPVQVRPTAVRAAAARAALIVAVVMAMVVVADVLCGVVMKSVAAQRIVRRRHVV